MECGHASTTAHLLDNVQTCDNQMHIDISMILWLIQQCEILFSRALQLLEAHVHVQ